MYILFQSELNSLPNLHDTSIFQARVFRDLQHTAMVNAVESVICQVPSEVRGMKMNDLEISKVWLLVSLCPLHAAAPVACFNLRSTLDEHYFRTITFKSF